MSCLVIPRSVVRAIAVVVCHLAILLSHSATSPSLDRSAMDDPKDYFNPQAAQDSRSRAVSSQTKTPEKSGDTGDSKDKPEKPASPPTKKKSKSRSGGSKHNKKKKKKQGREKLHDGDVIKSEQNTWKVSKLLGSGGFGDVYKVKKEKADDKKEYAMKTEMVVGDKRMLRLKVEALVLKQCHDVADPQKKKHFVEFVDRGISDKFKFLVMGLVGPSLEDIRKQYLLRNYSRHTAMQCAVQTLQSLRDLHSLGWLHRDIKPQNFAVGLESLENVIYMLDFGIAKPIFKGDSKDVKPARVTVKFLGTLRFASRACHHCKEQGRKDDLETWLYMVLDLYDETHGLPWKRAGEKADVIKIKEMFFKHAFPRVYKLVPKEVERIVEYLDQLSYADAPDYEYIRATLIAIAKDRRINLEKKLDWAGKLKKRRDFEPDEKFSSTSSDNLQSGSNSSSSSQSKRKKRSTLKSVKSAHKL